MLHLLYSTAENVTTSRRFIEYPGDVFDVEYQRGWLEDDLCISMLREIEQLDVHAGSVFQDMLAEEVLPRDLSNGVKNMFLAKFMDGVMLLLSKMGDNCLPYLMKIANEKDVYVCANIIFDVQPKDLSGRIVHVLNDDSFLSTYRQVVSWNSKAHMEIHSVDAWW